MPETHFQFTMCASDALHWSFDRSPETERNANHRIAKIPGVLSPSKYGPEELIAFEPFALKKCLIRILDARCHTR